MIERRTYMTPTKAAELAARLQADEDGGWEYIAVVVDGKNSYAIVRVYDDEGVCVGEL